MKSLLLKIFLILSVISAYALEFKLEYNEETNTYFIDYTISQYEKGLLYGKKIEPGFFSFKNLHDQDFILTDDGHFLNLLSFDELDDNNLIFSVPHTEDFSDNYFVYVQ